MKRLFFAVVILLLLLIPLLIFAQSEVEWIRPLSLDTSSEPPAEESTEIFDESMLVLPGEETETRIECTTIRSCLASIGKKFSSNLFD